MTQARLAELSGLTQAAISRLERGKCMPTFPLLERIAGAVGSALVVSVEPGRGVTVTFADRGDAGHPPPPAGAARDAAPSLPAS